MADRFELERFVSAQAGVHGAALDELKAGRKRTHWMWFVFPQLKGLGRSPTALFFGIASLEEARAYLAHPLLGARLAECTEAVLDLPPETSLRAIFGAPDDVKFVSCMSLFRLAEAEPAHGPFQRALDRYHGGRPDEATLALLREA